jgi:hypothetical protein
MFIAAAGTLLAVEQDDPRFAQWMDYSRTAFGNNHLTPALAAENSASQTENSSSPPFSDKIYTFQDIEKNKAALKDKVVKIEILRLLGDPSDLMGNGTFRFIAKDTSKSATPYGQVAFPQEGLQKMGLANDPHREGPFTVYARVHVFPEKKAAAISVAVGTQVSVENGKATYSW